MQYPYTAIAESEIPRASDAQLQHLVDTYASETNKTASMWRAVPAELFEFKPHEKCNSIRTILVHQLLSERRFFAEFVGIDEPAVDTLLPAGDAPQVSAYIDRYVELAKARLPQFAAANADWWHTLMPFFGGLERERIWIFWRRVLHTCHHRTQVQAWLRMGGADFVPNIYGPSTDVAWDEADPTYSVEAAGRGGNQ